MITLENDYNPHSMAKATTMALRLAHAETSLRNLSSGQIDAILDAKGNAYLLRETQEILLRKEKHLHDLFNSMPDMITVVDRGGVITDQNDAVKTILGYETNEMVGWNFFKCVHSEDIIWPYSAYYGVLEGLQKSATAVFRMRSQSGSYQMVEARLARLNTSCIEGVVFSMRRSFSPTSFALSEKPNSFNQSTTQPT